MIVRWSPAALAIACVAVLCIPARALTRNEVAGQLNLHNDQWDAVQVEVRLGPADSCDVNDSAGVRTLLRGQVWAVAADGNVCWRREATPGDGSGTWTAWQSQQPADSTTIDVSL
jgi:hypothetical protein